jgi:ribulose-phosphate 3-epimerase
MIEILPAVLPKNFKDLAGHTERIKGAPVTCVQIDVVDGVFARNRTWPYRDESTFANIVKEEHGLPLWDKFDFEFDLMLEHPEERVMEFVHAGALRIVVHAESNGALHAVQKLVDLREETGTLPLKVGIAVSCTAQPDILEPFEAQFDYVQVMGIVKVGFQGKPFDVHALHLLERLRLRYPSLPLQMDGGVTIDNAYQIVKAGATGLVVGSAIFKASDPVAAIRELQAEANRMIQ